MIDTYISSKTMITTPENEMTLVLNLNKDVENHFISNIYFIYILHSSQYNKN